MATSPLADDMTIYRALLNSMDEGFHMSELLYDPTGQPIDWRYLEVNPAFEQQTGLESVVGKLGSEVAPHTEIYWLQAYDQVLQTGQSLRFENYNQATRRRYSAYAVRIGPVGSHLFAVVFNDITQRKEAEEALRQSEERNAYLLKLSDALRPLTDATQIQAAAARVLAEQLGVDRAYYVAVDETRQIATVEWEYRHDDAPSIVGQHRLADFSPSITVYRAGHPEVIEDIEKTIPPEHWPAYRAVSHIAFLGIPLIKESQLVCVMTVASARPRRWTQDNIFIVEQTAERTWAAVERAKAEEALRQSQKRFESIANLVPDLLWDSQPDGSTNWYNQRWLDYTGQRLEEAIDWGWTDAIHPDDRDATARHYGQAVEAGTSLQQEHRIRRHDGVYRWFVVSASPFKDPTGQVVRMYGAATDIHDRKLAEEALHQADQRKDEFLAMLAHELRNPMATIRSGLHILTLTNDEDGTTGPLGSATVAESTVAMMNRQTDHLVRMVDDLLDISRISQSKIELHKSRVDLVELVSQAVDSTRPLFTEQGRSLHLDLPATPIYLEGDATRLTQVIANLLTNGVRYTGEAGQVWLRLAHSTGPALRQEAILEVRDNGIGLAADQLSAIFELFVQVDNSTARSKGGLGLGLTLVKRLVEMHGGRVEAQSEGLAKGSTFRVYLPTLDMVPEANPKPLEETPSRATHDRILVIDDNADAAFTLAMLLKLKGYEVHTRATGRAGLEAAEAIQPSAILLDIGMPELDGYATCRLLREQPWGRSVPVIALSGYGQDEDRQRTKEAGFTDHLVKPVDMDALVSLLARSLA